MLYKYNGSVVDILSNDVTTITLNPESNVEIPSEFESHPYFVRLLQSGSLQAVSPVNKSKTTAAKE